MSSEQISEFDWNEYLQETGSTAAPAECFFQAPDPPQNLFEDGMMLEAFDSRFPSIRCTAEVTARYGPKIRVRMVGAGDNDDIWVLVDNQQIRPVGTAESQGFLIQPPFNCRFEVAKFSRMVKSALETNTCAPQECFIPEPQKTIGNKFQVGWKIEASDTKDPVFVCPATVKEVKDDKIRVEFDGWNMSDWFRYDSRELYPVGWWQRSGAKIQPPHKKPKRKIFHFGKKANLKSDHHQADNSVQPQQPEDGKMVNLFDSAQHILTVETGKTEPMHNTSFIAHNGVKSGAGGPNFPPSSDSAATSAPLSPSSTSSSAVGAVVGTGGVDVKTPPVLGVKPKARKTIGAVGTVLPLSVDVEAAARTPVLNGSALWSSAADAKTKEIQPSKRSSIDEIVDSIIGSKPIVPKLTSPGTLPSPGAPKKMAPTVSVDGTCDTSEFVVYLNPYCSVGRWIDPSKLRSGQSKRFGPGNVNHVMRCCLQTLVDCAFSSDVGYVMNAVSPGDGDTTLSADVDGSMMVRRLPRWRSVLDAWKFLSAVLDHLQTCPHLLSKRFDACQSCCGASVAESSTAAEASSSAPYAKKAKVSPTVDALSLDSLGRSRHLSGGSSSSTCTERDLAGSGTHACEDFSKWTVDDVARFIYSVSDSVTSDLFKKQEIDGKAMLLLTADMMIRYMNVRLGPALKIGNAIDKFKSAAAK